MKFKNWISPSYKIYPEIRKIIWPVAAHKGMYLREPSQFSVAHFKSAKSISLSSFFLSVSMTAFSTVLLDGWFRREIERFQFVT